MLLILAAVGVLTGFYNVVYADSVARFNARFQEAFGMPRPFIDLTCTESVTRASGIFAILLGACVAAGWLLLVAFAK